MAGVEADLQGGSISIISIYTSMKVVYLRYLEMSGGQEILLRRLCPTKVSPAVQLV